MAFHDLHRRKQLWYLMNFLAMVLINVVRLYMVGVRAGVLILDPIAVLE